MQVHSSTTFLAVLNNQVQCYYQHDLETHFNVNPFHSFVHSVVSNKSLNAEMCRAQNVYMVNLRFSNLMVKTRNKGYHLKAEMSAG